ncbi:hypothetical protein ACTXT7_010266 [Hymenolepis weldensis]
MPTNSKEAVSSTSMATNGNPMDQDTRRLCGHEILQGTISRILQNLFVPSSVKWTGKKIRR